MAMENAMGILESELQARHEEVQRVGKVAIGTVKGDMHEIAKSLVATLLTCKGFDVCDAGVDVPTETFVAKVTETEVDQLGLSALLTGEDPITVVDPTGIAIQDIPIDKMVDHALREIENKGGKDHDKRKPGATGRTKVGLRGHRKMSGLPFTHTS
jgi:hypothetical protein